MGDEILLERILNGEEEPKDLPLALLQRITNDFSEDRKIGQGGFGAVYKGVLRSGIIVAVKRIYINLHRIDVDDKLFRREFNSMWRTNHQNVVRCLGFCSNTSMKPIEKDGSKEIALANVRERLFCLEYIGNGSLDKHITDELRGLGWKTRYEIITGICEGLCYLHEEKKIVHMDLKPANVLLHGKYMVPKITDFGLSRSDENSHTMAQPIGTVGYIAPEYVKDGKTSHKSDIYSLGAIIFELVTGCMSAPDKNSVLQRWRHRWNKPPTPLQYQQVTRCFEIAVRCRQKEPKDRPSIGDIISFLRKSESTDGDGHTGQGSTYLDDDMLRIEPLELIFDEEMSWSVKLTNKTKACFAFSIERPSKHYTIQPDKGIVTPGFKEYLVQIAMKAPQVTQNADKLIVRSTKVNEGLRVEDFPKDIFYEVAGKVVDEVDLMVLYEPGSLKSGQDPNVPVEAVSPEAINSNSYKDSAQGQCTKQLDRRNYHPPENFSRSQPTNMTYLLKVSDRAVDVTRGTMGSLLHKLGEVIKEFNLETSIKEDIESLSEELMKMQPVLRKVSEVKQDNLDDLVKRWAINVREMSYDLEDFVDSFLVHSEPDSNTSSFKELTHELCFLLEEGKSNHTIGHLIKDKTKQVQHEARRRKEYNVDDVVALAAATITDTIDPCMLVVFQRPKELVGIEEPRDNLIKRLSQVSEQQLRIFSIYGAGGSGKTTLAKAVYDKLEGQFHLMAFVSVGRNPDKKQVLRDIIDELPNDSNIATMDEKQLIKELHKLLKNNRYFIVIDDIWDSSAWSIIECAFPENNRGSRVVTTTRIHSVAVACCDDSRKYVCEMETLNDRDSRILFVSRIFGMEDAFPNVPEDILTGILKKCGGLPLAIISIASLVAKKDPRRRSTWDYVSKSLIAMFEGDNPTLTDMEQILNLSYMHLPNHLKTCLLSVGKYREDQEIEKDELLRQWIAEGFVVSTSHGLDAEDVAEDYFSELINMSMIQSVKIDYNNEVLSCRVHDIMLDLIRSKAAEENFIHVVHGLKDVSGAHGEIRRVSVHYYDSTILETIKESLSHVRSVKLDLIRSKAAEENLDDFFNGSDGLKEVTDAQGSFFPVSVIDNNTILETMSHVRSVLSERAALLSSRSRVLCFSQYKYLRVLHIEHLFHSLDLTGISRLFLLRYLKVGWSSNYYCELKLPSEIGELHQLETIDLDGASRLKRYPSNIVSLPRLSLLRFGGAGIPLPDGIGRLKSLRTLGGVALYESSVENIKGISQLTNLRKLEIRRNDHKRLPKGVAIMRMDALHSSICMLSASLRNLTFEGGWDRPVDVPACWSGTLFPGCCNIGELNLGCCRFERCPRWISQLHNLYKFTIMVWEVADGISIAAGLASLAYFRLVIFDCSKRERLVIFNYHYEEKEERVVIPGTGFQALKHLIFHCPNASLTFETGAMPKLEKLDIKFHYDMTRRFLPVGIQHLPAPTLAKIWLSVAKIWKGLVFGSKDCEEQLRDVSRKAKMSMTMLKSAFKQHHPVADIYAEEENDISNCIMTNKKILRAPLGPSS